MSEFTIPPSKMRKCFGPLRSLKKVRETHSHLVMKDVIFSPFLCFYSNLLLAFYTTEETRKQCSSQEEYDYWLPLAYKCLQRWTTFENKPSFWWKHKSEYNHPFLIFEKKVGSFTSIYNNTISYKYWNVVKRHITSTCFLWHLVTYFVQTRQIEKCFISRSEFPSNFLTSPSILSCPMFLYVF